MIGVVAIEALAAIMAGDGTGGGAVDTMGSAAVEWLVARLNTSSGDRDS